MVWPIENYSGKNKADLFMRSFIDNNYDQEIIALHNIDIGKINIDAILFCIGKGIIVLAIKDYKAEEIRGVTNQHMIKFSNRPVDYTGLMNAIANQNTLIDKTGIEKDSINIIACCCYPFISDEGFNASGLSSVLPRELVILKDDLVDRKCFDKKISIIFSLLTCSKKEIKPFEKQNVESICRLIDPKYEEALKKYSDKQSQSCSVDLHANSTKELFYGICSFLMKNGISTGYICSESRELLDGLGEYMSAVRIPWSYEEYEKKGVGYSFVDSRKDLEDFPRGSVVITLKDDNSINVTVGKHKSYNIKVHNKNEIYKRLNNIDLGNPIHLKNEQIREMFLKAFVVAESEIDIISPWMNFGVVNDYFVDLMKAALERGVIIKIIYGLTPDSSEYNTSRSNRSDQVAKYLRETFYEYSNQLYIKRDNIHYKLVLCDEKFKLEGGYNYLSFVGDYENKETRKEGSPFGTQIDEIRFLRREYFG